MMHLPTPNPLWTLAIKVVVFLYLLAIPFLRIATNIDVLPVFVAACVVGAGLLAFDLTLGTLVLLAAAVTMVTISQDIGPDVNQKIDVNAEVVGMMNSKVAPNPVAPNPPPAADPASEPDEPEPESETAVEEENHPSAPPASGQSWLLQPDGAFVTEGNLAAAQDNAVGNTNTVFSPLGPKSYSVQGGMGGLAVTGFNI